jgi:hypothetical protein
MIVQEFEANLQTSEGYLSVCLPRTNCETQNLQTDTHAVDFHIICLY